MAWSAAMLIVAWPAAGADEPTVPVVRVEQDWVLVLSEPDEGVNSPQFHTVMSPYGNLNSTHAQVTWNYRELPYYKSGGIQLQAWNGENCRFHKGFAAKAMTSYAETVKWTQVMEVDRGSLTYSAEEQLSVDSTPKVVFRAESGRDMSAAGL